MLFRRQWEYAKEIDLLYSEVYGRGVYQYTGRYVQNPLGGDDGSNQTAPLLENMITKEYYFPKLLNRCVGSREHYIRCVLNPPDRKNILWPEDLVDWRGKSITACKMTVEPIIDKQDCQAVLFPYGGYPRMTSIARLLERSDAVNWKNQRIRSVLVQIAEGVEVLNRDHYLYMDFDLNRLFILNEGGMYFDFSGLLLETDTVEAKRSGRWERNWAKRLPVEFAEPAIIQGKLEIPDRRSQNYSLAALFFSLMFGRYPYDGSLMDGYSDRTAEEHVRKFQDYHKLPIFIFDPEDTSNQLGDFTHEQEIVRLWEECPDMIRRMLTRALQQASAERCIEDHNPTPGAWIECFRSLGWP